MRTRKPTKIPDEVKDYAKQLFMLPKPDAPGKHLYSCARIAELVYDRFGVVYYPASIHNWAHKAAKGKMTWNMEYIRDVLKGDISEMKERQKRRSSPLEIIDDGSLQEAIKQNISTTTAAVRTELSECRDIYESKRKVIKAIIAVHINALKTAADELPPPDKGNITRLSPAIFNRLVPKDVQRLIVGDIKDWADRVDRLGAAGSTAAGEVMNYDDLTTTELAVLARNWIN